MSSRSSLHSDSLVICFILGATTIYFLLKSDSSHPISFSEEILDANLVTFIGPIEPPSSRVCTGNWASARNVWMVETGSESSLPSRIICSIESFALKDPNACVRFVVTNSDSQRKQFKDDFEQFVGKVVKNVQFVFIPHRDLFAMVGELTNISALVESSKFRSTLTSDIYRIVLLYKYGGLYSDTDVFAVRNFTVFGEKFVTRNYNTGAFASSVFAHPRGDSLLYMVIKRSFDAFKGDNYAELMLEWVNTIYDWCDLSGTITTNEKNNTCFDLKILTKYDSVCELSQSFEAMENIGCSFYHYTKTFGCLHKTQRHRMSNIINMSNASNTVVQIANKHCPNTFKFYESFDFTC